MKNRKFLKKIMILAVISGVLYVSFLQYKMIHHAGIQAPDNADFMIILGARVKGTVPSLALQFRIDHAAEYLKKNPNTLVIASGGKGPGEDISEAESIKQELIAQGIDESRILLEDQSKNTYENIGFSKRYIPEKAKIGLVVTNDFHIFRAKNDCGKRGN